MFAMRENKKNADGSRYSYTRAREDGKLSPEDLGAVYQKANEGRKASMMEIAQRNEDLAIQGFTEAERIEVMKKAGISSKDILATLDGYYNDMAISSKKSTSDIYNEQGDTMQEKLVNIKRYLREDPVVGKRLKAMWLRDQKSAKRGLSEKDSIIRNMDPDEKVDYLSRNPSMINEFRRKGLISDSVLQALRIRGII